VTGGFQGAQHAAAKEFLALGLLGKDDFERTKTGAIKGLKPGRHVPGWQLAQTDPDLWVQQYLLPAMRMHGYTDQQDQLAFVRRLFTTSRAADIVSKLITQSASFQNHASQMNNAAGLMATELIKSDPVAALDALTTSIGNFAGTLTGPIMRDAAVGMSWLSRTFAGWSETLNKFQREHPELAKVAGGAAITGGVVGGGALTYGLLRGLMSGFGLKTSAAALDVAAVNLNAAALRLGAGGAAGAVGGVAGNVAKAAPAAGLLARLAPWLPWLGGALSIASTPDILKTAPNGQPWPEVLRSNYPEKGSGSISLYDVNRAINGGAPISIRPAPSLPRAGASPSPLDGPRRLEPSANVPAAMAGQSGDAQQAGHELGRSFVQGLSDELSKAEAMTAAAVRRIIDHLTFSASPDVRPGGGSSSSGGSSSLPDNGGATRGMYGDYGIAVGP
jgi:hypothetical protein